MSPNLKGTLEKKKDPQSDLSDWGSFFFREFQWSPKSLDLGGKAYDFQI